MPPFCRMILHFGRATYGYGREKSRRSVLLQTKRDWIFPDGIFFPGLVESHFHGAVGEDFHEADQEGIRKIAAYEAAHGITTIIPTISSSRDAVVEYSLRTVGEAIREGNTGSSAIRRIHLEGPFLSDARKGSHLTIYLHRPSIEELDRLDKLSGEMYAV